MTNRRTFIKKISAIGATAPLVTNLKGESSKKDNPIIVCSRGEDWGKKVLIPGWEILSNNGKLLDAVEKSANVTLFASKLPTITVFPSIVVLPPIFKFSDIELKIPKSNDIPSDAILLSFDKLYL